MEPTAMDFNEIMNEVKELISDKSNRLGTDEFKVDVEDFLNLSMRITRKMNAPFYGDICLRELSRLMNASGININDLIIDTKKLASEDEIKDYIQNLTAEAYTEDNPIRKGVQKILSESEVNL